jgi:hypothetical protein
MHQVLIPLEKRQKHLTARRASLRLMSYQAMSIAAKIVKRSSVAAALLLKAAMLEKKTCRKAGAHLPHLM